MKYKTLSLVAVIIVVVGVLGYRAWTYHDARMRCFTRIKNLIYLVQTADGRLDQQRNLAELARQKAWIDPEISVTCPCSGQPYIYVPFAGELSATERRAIAWCPQACHAGFHLVLFENGDVAENKPGEIDR